MMAGFTSEISKGFVGSLISFPRPLKAPPEVTGVTLAFEGSEVRLGMPSHDTGAVVGGSKVGGGKKGGVAGGKKGWNIGAVGAERVASKRDIFAGDAAEVVAVLAAAAAAAAALACLAFSFFLSFLSSSFFLANSSFAVSASDFVAVGTGSVAVAVVTVVAAEDPETDEAWDKRSLAPGGNAVSNDWYD